MNSFCSGLQNFFELALKLNNCLDSLTQKDKAKHVLTPALTELSSPVLKYSMNFPN